ncbi:MAG TPA: Hsp20/alpha crystallin family protein [Verrucomicrobiae bacterium]|jgi:HSP20 family protein
MILTQCEKPGSVSYGRFTTLQSELEQLFGATRTWAPAVDAQEDKDKYSVRVELAGLKREDIEVAINDGVLVISGERKAEAANEGTEVLRRERVYGKFSRTLTLPGAIVTDQVKAAYKDGILTVTLPKVEEAKPKQIVVSE